MTPLDTAGFACSVQQSEWVVFISVINNGLENGQWSHVSMHIIRNAMNTTTIPTALTKIYIALLFLYKIVYILLYDALSLFIC